MVIKINKLIRLIDRILKCSKNIGVFGRIISCLGLLIVPHLGAETEWAYAPVENPELPKVDTADWTREEMDFFVLAGIEKWIYP